MTPSTSTTRVQQDGRLERPIEATADSMEMVQAARTAWDALARYRERRNRARDYYWGDQWSDTIEVNGQQMTEGEYIEEQGRIPWRMNHLKPTVRNLKGQLRQNQSDRQAFATNKRDDEAAEMMTQALRQVRRINRLPSMEADSFQEHLIGGKTAFKIGYKYLSKYDRADVFVQRVEPQHLFHNADLSDRRLHDLRLIGQLHTLTLDEIISSFAPRSKQRAAEIERVYADAQRRYDHNYDLLGFDAVDSAQFYQPEQPGLGRVIEVWCEKKKWVQLVIDPEHGTAERMDLTEAELQTENQLRMQQGWAPLEVSERYEDVWYGYYLSPEGHVLWEGETPYAHGEHPFVLGFADFMDGECSGIVDDLIDQQRLYNRMIGVMDLQMSTAARGVMMIPEEMIPEGMTPADFADEYQKVNGVIVYRAKKDGQSIDPRFKPEQVYNQSVSAGAFQWLANMKQDMEEVSGVTGPVMGQTPKSGTPAALYQQQVLQGSTTNIDHFETFLETLNDVDLKVLKTITQFYNERRPLRTERGRMVEFDPQRARDLEYDVAVARVTDTATYRQAFEQDLKDMRAQGDLTLSQYLEMSSHPRAHALKRLIQRSNPLLQQAQSGQGPAGQMMQGQQQQFVQQLMEAAEAGDRDAQAILKQAQ